MNYLKQAILIIFFLSVFAVAKNTQAATEFTSIIDTGNAAGTDYTSLSAWEAAVQSDLTATSTLVFSITGNIGTTSDGATIIGLTSGATGTVVHLASSSRQILIKSITGIFQNGEVISTGVGTSTLTSTGTQAIAVAKCRATTGAADTTAMTVDGWTTASTTYIKIWTDPTDVYGRHLGHWDDGKYRLIVNSASDVLRNEEGYTIIDGLQIKNTHASGNGIGAYNSSLNGYFTVRNSILARTGRGGNGMGGYAPEFTYNNIVYGWYAGIVAWYKSDSNIYNNTVFDCTYGIQVHDAADRNILKNNIVQNTSISYVLDSGCSWSSLSDNNISSDTTAPGTGSKINQTVQFLDSTNYDFHLSPDDTAARNAGTSTIFTDVNLNFTTDIDGTARGAGVDIGADEVPVEFVSTICENASAGGDCADMDYNKLSTWEDKVEVDLATSTTRVFGGTITGTLNENTTVNLCNGTTDTNIDGLVVATTSDQIIIDGITGSTNPVITTSGYRWSDEACASAANYWTVMGTGDALGASAQATGRIDGSWGSAETNNIMINGWTTDGDNYIRVYTTATARHGGKWDTSKYRLEITNNFYIYESDVQVDGLQIKGNGAQDIISFDNGGSERGVKIVSNSILRNGARGISGLRLYSTIKIFNNVIYNMGTMGLRPNGSGTLAYIYNNTIYNCGTYGIF